MTYKLLSEDYLYKDLIDQYNFFLCNLLPNNINIFPLIQINNELIEYVKKNYSKFKFLLFPVYKHLWKKKRIFIEKNKLLCSNNNKNLEYYNYNTNILQDIFLNNDLEIHNNHLIYIKKIDLYATFEAYSYLYLQVFKIITDSNLNYLFILGILEASIDLGLCSIPFKQEGKSKSVFKFSKISLKSLYISNQIQIFKSWLLKSDILLTGDTGIGKTSQIPKLYWWINFLFDGFESSLNFKSFNFNLESIPEIKQKSTILSLPRKILITENASNVAKSLGFNTIKGSPVNCLYKDVKNTSFYNEMSSMYINSFVFSINRITLITNVNTLIFDEIHEHDTYADIGITKAKYYKKRNNINNIILISATVSDDLNDIYKFLPNIQRIHIKGDTLYKIISIDYSKKYKDITDLINIIYKYSTEINKSTLIFLPSVSYITKIKNEMLKILRLNFYVIIELHRQLLFSRDVLKEITNHPTKHVIILSTPIAESSLTIVNVKVVIDFGLFYCKQFFSGSIMYITESMMIQRKGRVGRVNTGTYINLFPLDKLNKTFKRIDYEFLLPYIINCYYFNIKFEDIFILPTDFNRFGKTIEYFNKKHLNIKKNINKIYDLYNKYYITIPEYLIIYLLHNKETINILDEYENSFNKEKIIKKNNYIIEKIVKNINIKFNIIKKYNSIYRVKLIDYYEIMPTLMINIIKFNNNNKFLLDENTGIIC
jgi:hypothetical protein